MLNTKQLCKMNNDPSKERETNIQVVLQKIKNKLKTQEHKIIDPTGFYTGTFYGIAKIYQMMPSDAVNELVIAN